MTEQKKTGHYLVFTLSKKKFALPLGAVRRVVHAVEVTILPKAPQIVCGLINFKGQILPVLDISHRFRLPEKELEPDRHFVIVDSGNKEFALLVDTVPGVIQETTDNVVPPTDIIEGMEFLDGIVKLKDGMMMIPQLDKLLTPDQEALIDAAVSRGRKKKKNAKK